MFFITEDVPEGEPALMKLHENPFSFHIEHPGRLETIEEVARELKTEWIADNTKATEEQLRYAHTKEYIDIMATTEKLCKTELERFPEANNFEDIYVSNYTYQAALKAAGCGIQAAETVLETGKVGFAGLRPPGHHAGPAEASGFCYFNNVAIAAKHLVEKHPGLKKVLIVDWDVHCGQGTQDCVAGDERIKLVNIFRHEHGMFWPYLKHTGIRTTDPKYKNTVNVPLNSTGFGNSDYLAIMHLIVFPLIKDWQPQFIFVSCGFDAAFGDPEGDMRITPLGFAHMARTLSTVRNGDKPIPLAFFFEGGYFLPVVKESFKRLSQAMESQEQLPELERQAIHSELPATIHRVHEAHKDVFPHFDALFKLVEKFQKWPSMEEVDKFIGRQPDVVEKDACGKRTEEYEGELKKELSEIAKRERPASGNCPPVVIIATRSDGELSFTQEESSIAFHIPENTLETLLTSTLLLPLSPSQVPGATSTPPNMSDEQWVNDELHQILGLSDKTICKFVLSLAKKSRSTDDFIEKLQANDALEITPEVQMFAGNLMNRLPRAAPPPKSKPKGPSAAELRTMELARLNKSLSTVDYKRDASKKTRSLRQRKESSSEDEAPPKETVQKKKTIDSDDDDYIKEEEEVDRDIRERDDLAARIRQRDKNKTRSVLDKGVDLPTNKDKEGTDVAKIREESRRSYLVKRKEDKLEELARIVHDDETLFADEDLTLRERKDMEYRKKILEYAKAHDQADDVMKIKRYHLPDATTNSIPTEYIEETEERGGDAAKWEAEQIYAAMLKYGAKDAKSRADEFDLLLDDKIDFIQALQMPGENTGKKEDEEKMSQAQKKKQTIQETRRSLPVYNFRDQFIEAVKEHQVLIVEGETGSGKTTQLPQYLYEAGFCNDGKRIGCTQPRRVAAMSVASRVSEEVGCKLGHTVGYSIRFEDCTSDKTMLKYMTDGMLLREFLNEPDLASYSVMMIDEAHERTLHTDILFGLVKDIARFRKDLKLLISSATLDAEKFSTFFDDAPIFRIPGRRFPVDIYYTQAPEADYMDATMVTVMQIHLTQPLPGDILVFLTGQEEIESVMEAIQEKTKALGSKIKELIPLPIYANLPSDMQAKIFDPTPPNARKVVLATNIAETSVTIDGIAYVIDPGFSKLNSFDARSGVEHLHVNPISKAAADQRAGRAGRTGPGKCFRLYTAWAYKHELEDQPTPEIQRTNLGNIVLMLKSLGIHDLVHFDFLDPPPQETLVIALEQLYALGALNHRGELTKLGRRMAEFPTDPQMSKMIIASEKYECTEEIITIASMLSCNAAVFYRPKAMIIHADSARKAFWSPAGDHLTLMNVYNKWKETNYSQQWCLENFVQHRTMKKARDVRDQLEQLLERVEIEPKSSNDTIAIRKSITAGYFYNCSKLDNSGHYKTVKNKHTVHIHPNSCLFEEMPRWIVYYELVFTSKEFMREICQIESPWLMEVAPHYFKGKELEEAAKKMPKQRGKAAAELHG